MYSTSSSRRPSSEFKLVDAENGTNSTSTTSTSLGRRFGPTSPWKKWAIISAFSLGFLIYVAHNGPGFIIGHPPPPPPHDLSAIQDDFSNDFPDYYQPDYEKPHKKPSFDLPNSGVDNPLIDVTKDQSAKYGGSLSEAEASLPDDHQSIVNEQTFPSFSEEAPLNSELPTSFENDPNPSSTLACKSPHPDAINKGRPIVQYVVMIDAGSTGSRVHAYKFNNCHSTPQLEYETFKATEPGRGLSSFAGNPEGAARSLDPLLNEAVRVIPSHLHAQTPIAVKATAGLRILDTKVGPNASKEILDRVRSHVKLKYPFSVSDRPGDISVMDGSDEGVYAWITVNYLLERVGSDIDNKKLPTVAVMDLGGASTQIVFEPMSKTKDAIPLADGDHKYTLTYGGKQHVLYQHSYLGYGLMQARRSVHNLVAYLYEFGNPLIPDWNSWTPETIKVPNPCMPKGMQKIVQLDPPNKKHVSVTMVGASHGWDSCNRVVELVMAKDAVCEVQPCSFNGVYQPSLMETFDGPLLALSYFYDRLSPLGISSPSFARGEIQKLASIVCDGQQSWNRHWDDISTRSTKAFEELYDKPEMCLDLTFMNGLLGLGYELGPSRQIGTGKKIDGVELGWTLGASIAVLDASSL